MLIPYFCWNPSDWERSPFLVLFSFLSPLMTYPLVIKHGNGKSTLYIYIDRLYPCYKPPLIGRFLIATFDDTGGNYNDTKFPGLNALLVAWQPSIPGSYIDISGTPNRGPQIRNFTQISHPEVPRNTCMNNGPDIYFFFTDQGFHEHQSCIKWLIIIFISGLIIINISIK